MSKNQKQVEKYIARQFLEKRLHLHLSRLLACNPPRPDAYAVINGAGYKRVVEIELVEYQVDAPNGKKCGSPGERLYSFWREVQESLYRRLRKNPIKVDVSVTLEEPINIKQNTDRDFGEELVRLGRQFSRDTSNFASLDRFSPEFPVLATHVQKLTLKRVGYFSFAWTCTNASAHMVGISPSLIENLVRKKSKKAYKWSKNAEKWLLVCASGRSIVAHGGPRPDPAIWADPELQRICKTSLFDRVVFYDLIRDWHKDLK